MDAVLPGVPERLYLLRFTRDVIPVSVSNITARRRPLKIRIEPYPVGWVEIDALHLAGETFSLALREARHHRQAVTEDHAVRPVGVVLIEASQRLLVG